jgi:hypothetical protein
MNGELAPGTYRAKNGDLIHCREDLRGQTEVEVERDDGSIVPADVMAVRDAVRVSDDPDWPLPHPRLVGPASLD